MNPIPHEKTADSTFALLHDGYTFISRRCAQLQTDVFETRLMLRKAICAMGEEASEMFFHPGRFTRVKALPPNALVLLQDFGSVQLLDGAAHHWRKRMFMSLMTPERLQQMTTILKDRWLARINKWTDMGEMTLHEEMERLLCSAVCQWAGVTLTEAAVRQRADEFAAMIDGAGSVGLRNWRGLLLRRHTEVWVRSIIDGVRAGHMSVPENSPIHVIAWHRDENGHLLDTRVAGVELTNLLRPTVAVARYVTFAALALHQYPECREKLEDREEDYLGWFVHEVRRFYPFFPMLGGRVLEEFDWRGMHFARGTWVLLDLYGTNHDPRIWGDPEVFRPERFRGWKRSPFNFIPQGGGDFELGHRCAGEWLTIEVMKTAVRLLVSAMEYDVPQQDLQVDLARMPAIPASRFVMSRVRRRPVSTDVSGVYRSHNNAHAAW
ncbi:cytochrome P450 [Noviherbaspirillum agri]